MTKAKKFGTFSGVFTPSILTILGVIMYLRFPAIIGQAGLINTIGIIIIAHIISITTSLSVASLSTDKPVQNGGTYFMISRSLGLPIGGTLGLALFVGLSFSVSLYLIGFAESFLQYWGFSNDIQTIRLTGTIVLVIVTTITFISTSLAIKSQYIIMVAIALSLLSILLGKHDFAPSEINLAPLATAAPFMVLFGIFFPAVTGFEAGVSMSGDLSNPKKSLPLGAIMAVGVGFVVYIALAFFYAYTVNADALVNDPQILFKISLVPGLVIAGIWGATLSSALGSILGAPRILQAIAMDKIAPKFLAKGTGKTNEPRNALLVAFVIAEAGILIGELDVIASIVSMFFITTYAFLNLASAIESWSSSDFRPAFKIPRFVSILGALSAFFVMILLDFLALAGATVVLGLLYFYLQRKELILESGDAWSSFWTNLAKQALLKLSIQKTDKRNWRPNIILFSGGEKARPHLVEMGLSLTGKLGALTDFNLSYGQEPINREPNIEEKKKNKNIHHFVREIACTNIEAGIKTVTNVYGFSGFEPNTVLMGWSRDSQNIDFLVSILKDLKSKRLNASFLDYDKNVGFGKKEKIDIWWNGKGRHLSFALNLLRFLLADTSWRDAHVRILIINSDTSLNDSIYRNTHAVLADKRIRAEVKVLSDDFGSRTKEDIINSESIDVDLIILGISPKNTALTNNYINRINNICKLPASLLLLSPSSEFEEINLLEHLHTEHTQELYPKSVQLPALPEISNKVVRNKLEKLDLDLLQIGQSFIDKTLTTSIKNLIQLSRHFQEFVQQNANTLEKELAEQDKHELPKSFVKNHQAFLRKITSIIDVTTKEIITESQATINIGISDILTRLGNYVYESADSIHIPYLSGSDNKEKIHKYPYRKAVSFYLNEMIKPALKKQLDQLEDVSAFVITASRQQILTINDAYEKTILSAETENNKLLTDIYTCIDHFKAIESKLIHFREHAEGALMSALRNLSITLTHDLNTYENLKKSKRKINVKKENTEELLNEFSDNWGKGMQLLSNTLYLDSLVLSRKNIFKNVILKGNTKINTLINDNFLKTLSLLEQNLEIMITGAETSLKPIILNNKLNILDIYNETYLKASELINDFPEELSVPESIHLDSKLIPFTHLNELPVSPFKTASYYIDILFHEPFYRELEALDRNLRSAIVECKEANSMLLFHLNNIKESHSDVATEKNTGTELYSKLAAQVQVQKNKVETSVEKAKHYSVVHLQEAFSKLFYHSIIEAEKNIHSEKREQKGKKINTAVSDKIKNIQLFTNKILIHFFNSISSGVILSKKYLAEQPENKLKNQQILELVDQITPEKNKLNSVPVFYRKLMSSSSKINDELWVPRNREMNTIKDTLKRHKNGLGGATIIRGVHGAGKTALSRYAAYHLFKHNHVFWIDAPIGGSVETQDLLASFAQQTGGHDDFAAIFDNMPFDSAVVINNLELWWERRLGGGAVIEKIIQLIRSYGHKVFFILNCHTYSFRILSQLFPLEDNCLGIIDCEPFSSKELQSLILNRHKSSGLSLFYHGKPESNLSQLSYSILFNAYFNASEGIPGMAMNIWKANITDANHEMLNIKKPQKVNPEILYNLQHNWLITIALFIQHKNIGVEKLMRLTGWEKENVENLLTTIKNAGLIVHKTDALYCLGRNIEPLLVAVCQSKGII
ncbi:amino acid permease [Saccharicrinis fermentans]|uniref:Inner membrane transport protein YbaT n=1 Tax=Saccharicrinis fermentans DSM 9555 = JCM 21142 TaxID=869213 RepID=W7XXT1_9BACT|nr:amino acid permease [Saccharicrinis fermentans]GAF03305.1 inner membrane transport protein YbaT [Saccharicrinis fermentans DSM 9555 = JCM 21142]